MDAELTFDERLARHAIEEADRLGDRCAELEDLLARVLGSGFPLPKGLVIDIASALREEA